MAKAKTIEILWGAKHLCYGCETIADMAKALEEAAADLRAMAADGVKLTEPVHDDFAYLAITTSSAELIKKYDE